MPPTAAAISNPDTEFSLIACETYLPASPATLDTSGAADCKRSLISYPRSRQFLAWSCQSLRRLLLRLTVALSIPPRNQERVFRCRFAHIPRGPGAGIVGSGGCCSYLLCCRPNSFLGGTINALSALGARRPIAHQSVSAWESRPSCGCLKRRRPREVPTEACQGAQHLRSRETSPSYCASAAVAICPASAAIPGRTELTASC